MPKKTKPAPPSVRNGKNATRKRADEVFATAVEIFNERGYAATSVEDVAAAVGILKGSLYYYIDSKEDLLYKIVSEVHEDALNIIDGVSARTDLAARERLALYVRNQARYNAVNVLRVAVYYRDVDQLSEGRLKEIRTRQRKHFRVLVDLIREAQESGQIATDMDPTLAAHSVLSTMIWPYTWFRPNGKVRPDELAEFCVGFVLAGLEGYNPPPAPADTPADASVAG